MTNFISQQIINALNQKFGNVGSVEALDISKQTISLTLNLNGENAPITLEVRGLEWSVADGKMNLFFDELLCPDKRWVQEIFSLIAEKTGRVFSFPDSLKMMPLKMLLQKRQP